MFFRYHKANNMSVQHESFKDIDVHIMTFSFICNIIIYWKKIVKIEVSEFQKYENRGNGTNLSISKKNGNRGLGTEKYISKF